MGRLSVKLLYLTAVVFATVCGSAKAGELEVRNDNASIGDRGLRATLDVPCSTETVVVTGPVVNSDQLACLSVTTSGAVEVAGDVTFTAGDRITLGEGFNVPVGQSFTASVSPNVNSPYAFVQSERPDGESTYNARFDLNVDGLSLVVGEDVHHLVGLSQDGTEQFRLLLRNTGFGIQLALAARTGGILVEHGELIDLEPGFNSIEVEWSSGSGPGVFLVVVNSSDPVGPENLMNSGARIDRVRWGLVDGTVATSDGHIDQDDFFSFR